MDEIKPKLIHAKEKKTLKKTPQKTEQGMQTMIQIHAYLKTTKMHI